MCYKDEIPVLQYINYMFLGFFIFHKSVLLIFSEVLHRVQEDWNILHAIKIGKDNWTGHTFRRNGILKHITERKIEGKRKVKGRRARGRKQLLHDLKNEKILETERGSTSSQTVNNLFWKTIWTSRKAECRMNEWMNEWMLLVIFLNKMTSNLYYIHFKIDISACLTIFQ